AVVQHHERIPAAVAILLQEPADTEPHVERRGTAGECGLPRLQPGAILQQLALKDTRVARPDEPQLHRTVTVPLQQVHPDPRNPSAYRLSPNSLSHGRSSAPRSSRSVASWTIALM